MSMLEISMCIQTSTVHAWMCNSDMKQKHNNAEWNPPALDNSSLWAFHMPATFHGGFFSSKEESLSILLEAHFVPLKNNTIYKSCCFKLKKKIWNVPSFKAIFEIKLKHSQCIVLLYIDFNGHWIFMTRRMSIWFTFYDWLFKILNLWLTSENWKVSKSRGTLNLGDKGPPINPPLKSIVVLFQIWYPE